MYIYIPISTLGFNGTSVPKFAIPSVKIYIRLFVTLNRANYFLQIVKHYKYT